MKKFIATTLAVIAACLCAMAQTPAQNPMMQELPFDKETVKGVLPNGMTYYLRHNENPKNRAFFYIAQRVGSVQEDDSQRGLAHFLEHMCFNGSDHFAGNGIVNFCQRIGVRFGADLNAYTATDRTVYNVDNVPTDDPKNIDSCLYILYDWANGLTLDPQEIDKERGVIHEEWRGGQTGIMRILERQLPVLYPDSKYGYRLPIGTMEVVDNFPPQVLRDYYEKWYRPDLQAIIVMGDIDIKEIEAKIKDIFGKIPAQPDAAKWEAYPVPDNEQPIIIVDKDKEITTPMQMVGVKYDVLPREQCNTISSFVMDYVMGQIRRMLNYRLTDLSEDKDCPMASAGASTGNFILAATKGSIEVETYLKQGREADAIKMVAREFLRLGKYGFTEPEYKRAKTEYISSLDQQVDGRKTIRTGALVQECVNNFIFNKANPDFNDRITMQRQLCQNIPLQVINQVVMEAIGSFEKNMYALYIYPDKEGQTVVSDADTKKAIAEVKAEEIAPYEAKVVDTKLINKPVKKGKIAKTEDVDPLGYKTLVLENGIKVKYRVTDFDESEVSFAAVSHGGWSQLKGCSMDDVDLFNKVMADNGLGRFSGNELSKAMTGRMVNIAPHISELSEGFDGGAAKKDFRTLFELLHLYYTDVNYDTVNFNRVKAELLQSFANREANPMNVFQDAITRDIHSNHPSYQPLSTKRIENAKYPGIYNIYKERFANPADFTFIFTGAFAEDSLKAYCEEYLAGLPTSSDIEKKPKKSIPYFSGIKEDRILQKMETPQCIILQLMVAPSVYDTKTNTVAEATGMIIRMSNTEIIREKHSFAYSTQALVQNFCDAKPMAISQIVAPVKPEKCDSVLLLIDECYQSLAATGGSEEHLSKAKEQMLKVYENNLRRNDYWEKLEMSYVTTGVDLHKGKREALEGLSQAAVKDFVNNILLKKKNRLNVILLPAEQK